MQQNQLPFAPVRARRRHLVASAAAAACLLLSACGSSAKHVATSTDTALPTPSASPSPNPTDTAKAALLTAYQGFWNTAIQAWSQGSLDGIPINRYAVENADYLIRSGLQYYVSQGLVMRGRPILSPTVSVLNMTAKPYTATITDCIDTTNFYPVDKSTGKPVALTSPEHRHPGTYKARFDVQWWIISGSIDRSRTC
ncbi:hypothetical protein [Streptacidiphilus rugosus]|uniref:hypothetical protein n=1 Tax=Streptacidiphilus rugosus TaxID=405783 RepID=UPI0005699818|nr:hypothetical protein [Streptacidiphilus rugosus]